MNTRRTRGLWLGWVLAVLGSSGVWPAHAQRPSPAETPTATTMATPPPTSNPAQAMTEAAQNLIRSSSPAQRKQLLWPFTDALRSDWHYAPRKRIGVALKDMDERQRAAARQLLQAPLSQQGMATVEQIMALEHILKALDGAATQALFPRIPGNYAIAMYGDPQAHAPWSWRIEGHHLYLHFTFSPEGVVATLPQFLGSNPATVPAGLPPAAQVLPSGHQVLGQPAQLAWALLGSLSDAQRRQAIVSAQAYGNIVSDRARRADPLDAVGLRYGDMTAPQRAQLMRLVESFAQVLKKDLAAQRMARVHEGAANDIRWAWTGGTKPGQGYYFRIQGARFLIEYDNASGNHVHSVWRDFDGDWGRNWLADHYHAHRGDPQHRHGARSTPKTKLAPRNTAP